MADPTALGAVVREHRLARAALAEYGLVDTPITKLSDDYNLTFRVEAPQGRCVLRIQLPGAKTPAQVRSEMQWLAALRRDTELSVPEPVPTLDGSLVATATVPHELDRRVFSMVRWMPGRFVRKRLQPAHLEQVGAFTARLHEHALGFPLPADFLRHPVGALTEPQAERAVGIVGTHATADDARMLEAVLAKAARSLAGIDDESDQIALIHADLHQFNYLFHEGEVRAIDFDDCSVGPLLYDLAVTINTLGVRPNLAAQRAALLHGYQSVRPLPAAIETRLDALIAVRVVQDIPGVLDPAVDPASSEWLPRALRSGLPRLREYAAG